MEINKAEIKKAYFIPHVNATHAAINVPIIFAIVTAPLIKLAEARLSICIAAMIWFMLAVPPTHAIAKRVELIKTRVATRYLLLMTDKFIILISAVEKLLISLA